MLDDIVSQEFNIFSSSEILTKQKPLTNQQKSKKEKRRRRRQKQKMRKMQERLLLQEKGANGGKGPAGAQNGRLRLGSLSGSKSAGPKTEVGQEDKENRGNANFAVKTEQVGNSGKGDF